MDKTLLSLYDIYRLLKMAKMSQSEFQQKYNIRPSARILSKRKKEINVYKWSDVEEKVIAQRNNQNTPLHSWLDDDRYVQTKELAELWGLTYVGAYAFLSKSSIKPTKKLKLASGGRAFLYDRAECERARPFINQPEQKEVEKVENIEELATATKHQILIEACADDFVWDKVTMKNKIMPVKNYCDERGNFVSLFKKDETVSAILAYKNEQKQLLEKCLADKNLVTTKELVKIWNLGKSAVYNKIYRLKIKPYAKIKLDNGNMWHFYKKSDCIEFYQQINNTGASNECLSLVESDKYNPDNHATMKDLMKFTGKSRYMIMQRFNNKGITPISKPLIGKTVSYVYDLQQSLTVLSDILKPQYRKLIVSETKEIKTMEEKQMELPEPKEQTPDVIPADTIDSYTLKQLESELQNRGVELTPVTAGIIRGSDMPELKQVAKMLDGEADSIILSGAKLGEIASFLEKSECVASILQKTEKPKGMPVDFFPINGDAGVFYLNKELKNCPFCGSDSVEVSCEELTPVYWVAKIYCNGCEITTDHDEGTMESAAEVLIDFWNRRVASESSVELQKTSGIDSTAIKSQISKIEKELISLKNMLS